MVDKRIDILKGLHPGLFLERELNKRGLSKGRFAMSIGELPQTLSPIFRGRRGMNTSLSLRIEAALGLEEGFLMMLQLYHDIKQEKEKVSRLHHPDLSKFRPALFWDTRIENIDWERQKKAVISRVFDRGSFSERKEVVHIYGPDTIRKVLASKNTPQL